MTLRTAFLIGVMLVLAVGALPAQEQRQEQILVNLELSNVDARTALEALFRAADKQYVFESSISGSIAEASFKDAPFDTALKQLTRSAGLTYRVTDGIYNVAARPEPKQIEVDYAPPIATDVQLVAEETVVEKIPLIHTDALEIIALLQQAGALGTQGGSRALGGMAAGAPIAAGGFNRYGQGDQMMQVPTQQVPNGGLAVPSSSRGQRGFNSAPVAGGFMAGVGMSRGR